MKTLTLTLSFFLSLSIFSQNTVSSSDFEYLLKMSGFDKENISEAHYTESEGMFGSAIVNNRGKYWMELICNEDVVSIDATEFDIKIKLKGVRISVIDEKIFGSYTDTYSHDNEDYFIHTFFLNESEEDYVSIIYDSHLKPISIEIKELTSEIFVIIQ